MTAHGLPVELTRTLQLLQDRIARGSTQAHVAQRQLLGHIEQRLTALDPETWAEAENVRAAVTFALAGGGPAVLRALLTSGKATEAEQPLALGALAYLEGREREARAKLAGIDPRTMPAGLAGQLALTQSALMVREAPAKSLELLDLARLLAPGTLVEEGALRRQIFVVAQGGDARRFEALSIQYLRRFRHSVYAGNFRQRFAAALTRLDFTGEGILISLTDEVNFTMFGVGSAEPQAKVVRALEQVARILKDRPGRIVVRGHTDGRPFRSETYDNWRLSSARAQMASYMLVRGGVADARLERIEGYADRQPRNPADPKAAENRRIEILLRGRPE